LRKIWRNNLRSLAILILVLTSFRSAVADWNDVPTGSMIPTILIGDRILVNKLAYGLKIPYTTWHIARWSTPQRGDIVVFNSPKDGTRLVKRVVGLPGDRIEMINDQLYINHQPLQYQSHGNSITETLGEKTHSIAMIPQIRAMRTFGPIVVPAGEYFMMGDNRDISADSRYIGTVKLDQILGRSSRVALSLDYDHYFLPRWNRFFKSMQ
ncbi:MAG TPA: signal peptidase I, partial [Tepidisphaeraceae bacterium]|nr:signal peptidase I [Tepidisphaeraceae bacterium]